MSLAVFAAVWIATWVLWTIPVYWFKERWVLLGVDDGGFEHVRSPSGHGEAVHRPGHFRFGHANRRAFWRAAKFAPILATAVAFLVNWLVA